MGTRIDGSAIDKVLEEAVGTGAVPHVAAIAADRDGVIYEGGAGVRIAGESDDPVTAATQFRIMSMTKMVCTAAALQQLERGELDFDAPVDTYVPRSPTCRCSTGSTATPRVLRAPASRATVRHLVTHTAGLGYWFWDADLMQVRAGHRHCRTSCPAQAEAFKAPMLADPGTRFTYGINTDWLGRVVEAVAGTTLDVVVKENITGPLGMADTMFRLDDAAHGELRHRARPRARTAPGSRPARSCNQTPDWWAGGHGLYSTPRDYIRFERVLLRGGELDGRADPEAGDGRRGVHQPDRRAGLPGATSRPPTRRSPTTSTSARAGSGATACC